MQNNYPVTSIGESAFYYNSGITSITIPNSVTSIGFWAFGDCSNLTSICIGKNVSSIKNVAFHNCSNLEDIYCYATTPPVCRGLSNIEGDGTFFGVSASCHIYVPLSALQDYQVASVWSDFSYFHQLAELPEGTPSDQVGVTVTGNNATFSWRINPAAIQYVLTITKGEDLFTTLVFDKRGQLSQVINPIQAPARERQPSAYRSNVQSVEYGFSYVVTNLEANSNYTYSFTVNNIENKVLETYSGSFDTSTTTALPTTEQDRQPTRKTLRDGQVLILRNGETYDMMGKRL